MRKSGKNSVAVVETAGAEGCNELGHHIVVDIPSDLFQTSELVEAAGYDQIPTMKCNNIGEMCYDNITFETLADIPSAVGTLRPSQIDKVELSTHVMLKI